MSALLGVRFARALMLDDEVRTDWEAWLKERYSYLYEGIRRDGITNDLLREIRGQLRELDELTMFIEQAIAQFRREQLADKDNGGPAH